MTLPVGLVYDPLGQVVLDPDEQVQHSLHLCSTPSRGPSGLCRGQGEKLLFPHRPQGGPHRGELHWKPLKHTRVRRILHNPRYAALSRTGARCRRRPGGGTEKKLLAREEWTVLLCDAHPGFWERFEQNERQLRDNAQARGLERRAPRAKGPPCCRAWPSAACAART